MALHVCEVCIVREYFEVVQYFICNTEERVEKDSSTGGANRNLLVGGSDILKPEYVLLHPEYYLFLLYDNKYGINVSQTHFI